MTSRKEREDVAQVLRQGDGRGTVVESNMRATRSQDYRGRRRLDEIASLDCAEQVARVLNRLGYGFNVIPRERSAPKRA